jgi:hypothetical protein
VVAAGVVAAVGTAVAEAAMAVAAVGVAEAATAAVAGAAVIVETAETAGKPSFRIQKRRPSPSGPRWKPSSNFLRDICVPSTRSFFATFELEIRL